MLQHCVVCVRVRACVRACVRAGFCLDLVCQGGSPPKTWGIGGMGGTAVGGDLNFVGGYGHSGNIDGAGNSERAGNGGDTVYWKGGGSGASHWGDRRPGKYGGGGGGEHADRGDNAARGKGGNGMVYVEEYGSSIVVAKREETKLDDFGANVAVDGIAFGSGSLESECSAPGPTNNGEKAKGEGCIKNINDGGYGQTSQWIPNKPWRGKHFVGIVFKNPIVLGAVALSRDNKEGRSDRIAGHKTIQYVIYS